MPNSPDDIITMIDTSIGCQHCGGPLADSPSPDFCSEDCQQTWHTGRVDPLPAPSPPPRFTTASGWIELPKVPSEQNRTVLRLGELPPVNIEVPVHDDGLLRLFTEPLADHLPYDSHGTPMEMRTIPVREFTTDLGTMYEAVAEIVPRYGEPVSVSLQYATPREITPAAYLITTPAETRLELRDERTGHLLSGTTTATRSSPELTRPMTGERPA